MLFRLSAMTNWSVTHRAKDSSKKIDCSPNLEWRVLEADIIGKHCICTYLLSIHIFDFIFGMCRVFSSGEFKEEMSR